ncbi:Putative 1-phosphatidylinositol-3-phosphate 5-kinase FAB1D [Frankliniella fusca]|uniref:1-phosphatidylinositol-3-phosphate 5-kinase FAB1D n=1 Tax=Frankliniella fusca TaxID=407009 RepID=A0AAE1HUZ8_9NEOP|nr:Putative 1-phosphatidylinositol-3-phosphate 5-kinase FAB1D [Frankliniella fusca]
MWLLNIICHFKSQDFTCISATDLANPGRFSMHLEVMVHVVNGPDGVMEVPVTAGWCQAVLNRATLPCPTVLRLVGGPSSKTALPIAVPRRASIAGSPAKPAHSLPDSYRCSSNKIK